MPGPWEAYQQKGPTVKERAAEAGIDRTQAATGAAQASAVASQASAAASQATAAERTALLPAKQRAAAATARIAETKAEQAEIALRKAKMLISSLPTADKVPEAREILLREIRNLAQARELSDTMFSASGLGYNMLEGYSGSPAATVAGLIQPISANEAFTALAKMRAESPTGGALGNVTEMELNLLKSAGGFTPPTAGDKAFQQGIDDLISKRIKVLNRLGVAPGELAQALGPGNVERFAPAFETYRFRKEDEEALDAYIKKANTEGTFDPSDFAALMGQAYYNATGNQPDDAYINSAFESGMAIMNEGRTSLGTLDYKQPDEDARAALLESEGALAPAEIGVGEALTGAAINFVPSTFELAADTVKALTVDLPDTIEGVASIIGGAVGLSDPAAANAVKEYFVDRYGTTEGFKRALRDDPASIMADVAGIATGGSLLAAKTASTAAKVSKIAALSTAAKKAEDFGAVAAKLDPLNTAASITQFGARTGARAAENLGVALPAKLLGVQTADVKQAADAGRRGSQTFRDTLEGRSPPEDAITKAQSALTELYQSRSADYTRRMNRLKKQPETLAFDDVEQAIEGVRRVGRHKGIDISGASSVWDEVDAKVMEFFDKGLNTIEDFDAMKRAVGNIRDKYQRGTPEYKVANDVARAINNTITEKAPVYAQVMRDYRVASDTLSDIQASMSLGAKSGDTTLGKLRRAASERGPRGRSVLDLLESTQAGRGLGDMLAAQNLSATEPSGLGATAGAVGAVGMGDPTLTAASAMSPRSLGEAAYKFGEGQALLDRGRAAVMGLPRMQELADLTQRYGGDALTGVRLANPALIQPQADPMAARPEVSGKSLEGLLAAYADQTPTLGGPPPGQVSLGDLSTKYEGPTLTPDNAPPLAPAAQQGTIMLGDREVRYDPEEDAFFDVVTGEKLEGYKQGGEVRPRFRDRARAVASGATFAFNDEIEAGLRALAQFDPAAYQREVARIRQEQKAYQDAHPLESLGLEVGGAMATGLIPGAQGATGARLAQLAAKYPARTGAAMAAGDAAFYGAGAAESLRDIPRSVAEEMLFGLGLYGGARGAKAGYQRLRGRR